MYPGRTRAFLLACGTCERRKKYSFQDWRAFVFSLQKRSLSLLYKLALWLRALAWDIRQPTLIGVRALVLRGDEVLLIRHRGGHKPWSIPGGGVERHERLSEAIRREVYEETGMPVHVERLLGVYDAFFGQVANYVAVFICTAQGEPAPPRSLEIETAQFVSVHALPPDLDDGARRRIQEYLQGLQGVSKLY